MVTHYPPAMTTSGYEKMGWLRAAVGVALVVAPRLPMRVSGRELPTGSTALLMRTIGIRDLVLGLGTVSAARTPGTTDVRRWTTAALASDSLDTVVSLASARSIGGHRRAGRRPVGPRVRRRRPGRAAGHRRPGADPRARRPVGAGPGPTRSPGSVAR